MSRNAFFNSQSEKTFFDVDIVVKNKSKCGLAWSVLLSTISTHHHSGQNLLWTREAQHFDHRDDAYSLSIKVQATLNHISICFLPQYQRQRIFFFSERELKNALHDTVTRAALSGLLSTTAN